MTGSISTAPMRRLRGFDAGRSIYPKHGKGMGAAGCAGTFDTCGVGGVILKTRIVLSNDNALAQPTAATKDGVDPVRVGLTSRRTRRPICAELHGSVLHAMSWVAFDGEGPPCIGKPPSLPESACRSGPASESALFPERLMMLALQSSV
jgi:hypothetical protein